MFRFYRISWPLTMSCPWKCSLVAIVISMIFFIDGGVLAVAVSEVRLLSDSNRVEYVLHGEGATLTCHYILEPSEKVTEVEWEKDGELVYLWSLGSKPKPYSLLKGHVDLSVNSPSTLPITKVTMEMTGSFSCKVRTNGKTAQNEVYVMVIVEACSEDAWRTYTDMITCTESINMHCVGIYPKPSPACGVYSELSGKYLSSVPFDSVNVLWNRTYEVSFNRRFQIADWINHTDISFRCYMVVLNTPWRSGIRHKMFGDPGCTKPIPEISNGYHNVTQDMSCWGHPSEGSFVEYFCNEGYDLIGPSVLTCIDGMWRSQDISDEEFPRCSDNSATLGIFCLWWIMPLMMLWFGKGRT